LKSANTFVAADSVFLLQLLKCLACSNQHCRMKKLRQN